MTSTARTVIETPIQTVELHLSEMPRATKLLKTVSQKSKPLRHFLNQIEDDWRPGLLAIKRMIERVPSEGNNEACAMMFIESVLDRYQSIIQAESPTFGYDDDVRMALTAKVLLSEAVRHFTARYDEQGGAQFYARPKIIECRANPCDECKAMYQAIFSDAQRKYFLESGHEATIVGCADGNHP